MITIIIAGLITILSGCMTVLFVRSLFKSSNLTNPPFDNRTPEMFHVTDPYISALVRDLYNARGRRHENMKDTFRCGPSGCGDCCYSGFSAIFHKVPHRECYRAILNRYMPGNLLKQAVYKVKVHLAKGKLVQYNESVLTTR